MNPELFTHYGTQIRKKSKRVYRKSLKLVIVSKNGAITTIQTTTHYAKEIKQQAKVFKNNIITNQINKYDYEARNKTH
jgi:hypothetical protein